MRSAGRAMTMSICLLAAAGHVPAPVAAQEFVPPRTAPRGGTRIGLFGFGVRGGVDFRGAGQLVLGAALDLGDLFSDRLRLRPSGEIGVFNGPNTYVGNLEVLWRFTHDDDAVIPYLGGGVAIAGHQDCGADPGCPGAWLTAVLGIELHYRSSYNWLLEYHAMDLLQRHRFYIGLTTRRGN